MESLKWFGLLLLVPLAYLWQANAWIDGDWRLQVEAAAAWVGSMCGAGLFGGLWLLLVSVSGTVRNRSVEVSSRPSVGGSGEPETDWFEALMEPLTRWVPECQSLKQVVWLSVVALLALLGIVVIALVGAGAFVVGVVEWRVLADEGAETFFVWLGVAALAGVFLWARFVAAVLGERSSVRRSLETGNEARARVWSAMACPPLLAALVLAAPMLGIRRGTMIPGLVSAVELVLFVVAVFGVYHGGRLLWRRAGEVVG